MVLTYDWYFFITWILHGVTVGQNIHVQKRANNYPNWIATKYENTFISCHRDRWKKTRVNYELDGIRPRINFVFPNFSSTWALLTVQTSRYVLVHTSKCYPVKYAELPRMIDDLPSHCQQIVFRLLARENVYTRNGCPSYSRQVLMPMIIEKITRCHYPIYINFSIWNNYYFTVNIRRKSPVIANAEFDLMSRARKCSQYSRRV